MSSNFHSTRYANYYTTIPKTKNSVLLEKEKGFTVYGSPTDNIIYRTYQALEYYDSEKININMFCNKYEKI